MTLPGDSNQTALRLAPLLETLWCSLGLYKFRIEATIIAGYGSTLLSPLFEVFLPEPCGPSFSWMSISVKRRIPPQSPSSSQKQNRTENQHKSGGDIC
jgi:hypothetical protein